MLFFISPLKGDVPKDLDKQKPVGEVLNIYHVWNKLSVAIAGKGKENNEIKKIGTHIFSFGEDACFVTLTKHISPKAIALGVADGVGGWRKKGIDPGDFSRALVGYMQNATAIDPQQIIQEGYDCLLGEKKVAAGSSTACVATIDNLILKWANLGDSGLKVIRDQKITHETIEQQSHFDCPFQLSVRPPDYKPGKRHPSDCSCGTYILKQGDIIIMATDGLFDNVDDATLIQWSNLHHNTTKIAESLLIEAIQNSQNPTKESPFEHKARASGKVHSGGKEDDITIIVVKVL
ncbi:PP2C family serine/threonine-protein phosphatase [Cardinium endosymbiont of Culicoides punctatus]|uniref:PP2C family serine/threonine-protein phosphatase n=1 Tax=Cardinium endosymbiont of Culicoides punctatus TaxID=2304601 RepID=UPI001404885D|nr:PP2C family serine/threonine-protein phosphatase [Cardinium endosymbiont of Culicoides punctatus]